MSRNKIVIRTFGGRVNIVTPDPNGVMPTPADRSRRKALDILEADYGRVLPVLISLIGAVRVTDRLIELMELRVESIFRPKEDDYEVAYALSGASSNTLDMLHKLATDKVVVDASPVSVQPIVEEMVHHIKEERGEGIRVVVQVHTHPLSIPEPSDADIDYFRRTAPVMRSMLPDATAIFAIHAVSSDSIRARKKPERNAENRIRWTSITREHEVAFYDEYAAPYGVDILG